MGAWIREDCDQDWHPQVRRAGFLGAVVARAVRRAVKQFGTGNHVGGDHVDRGVLADRLGSGCTPEMAADGLAAAVRAGLIADCDGSCNDRNECNGVTVPGWSRFNKPPSADPERVKARVDKCRKSKTVTSETDVTTCNDRNDNGTGRTLRDTTGRDDTTGGGAADFSFVTNRNKHPTHCDRCGEPLAEQQGVKTGERKDVTSGKVSHLYVHPGTCPAKTNGTPAVKRCEAPTCDTPGGATDPPWYAVAGVRMCVSCKDRAEAVA